MKRNEIIRETGKTTHGILSDMEPPKSYFEKREKAYEIYDKFMNEIKDNKIAVALYEKLYEANIETFIEERDFYYSEGFRWGVLLGMDIANPEK